MSRLAATIAILVTVFVPREPLVAASSKVMIDHAYAIRSAEVAPTVHDIRLKLGNFFRGQLPPDAFPKSKQDVWIRFYRENHLIAVTKTDRLGRFTLRYLPTGTGTLAVSANGTTKACFCRLWAPGTAPPTKTVMKKGTVRAQNLHVFPTMSFKQVATVVGVVGGAIATPIIWHNIQQNHKTPVSGS